MPSFRARSPKTAPGWVMTITSCPLDRRCKAISRCHRSPPPHWSTVLKKQNDFKIIKYIVIKIKQKNQENKVSIPFLVNLGGTIF